jgi:hypothetical protein
MTYLSIEEEGAELVPIPSHYVWMTAGYQERAKLFKRYVEDYVKNNFPDLEFIRIAGMTAICQRK